MEKIRNLSVRKTIILYLSVSLLVSFVLSAFIVRIAEETQDQVWWKYVDQERYFEIANAEDRDYLADIPRPPAYVMSRGDHQVSELCDFLQTYTVLLMSILGSCGAVFLFYRNKLKTPIEELEMASRRIAENDLDFQITYENQDEMGHLCREFERMRSQLLENNQALWRNIEEERILRAAIAHDLRSPLSVLKGYQEMLLDYLPDGTIDTEKAVEMLSEGMKQIGRMDAFVETMRRMNSLEARTLLVQPISPEELEADIQAELRVLAGGAKSEKRIVSEAAEPEKRAVFETAGRDKNVVLEVTGNACFAGDKEVIFEVAENLLSNALRYAKTQVEIRVQVTVSELRICVKDDGDGFQENPETVTKAFHQQNAKDSLKHAGLGMYISRLYCEKHGGKLIVENEEGGAVTTAVFGRMDKRG